MKTVIEIFKEEMSSSETAPKHNVDFSLQRNVTDFNKRIMEVAKDLRNIDTNAAGMRVLVDKIGKEVNDISPDYEAQTERLNRETDSELTEISRQAAKLFKMARKIEKQYMGAMAPIVDNIQ